MCREKVKILSIIIFSSICKLIIIKVYVMKYFKPNIKFHDRLKDTEGIEILSQKIKGV